MTAVQVDAQGVFLRFIAAPEGDSFVVKNDEGYVICVPFPDGFRKFVTDKKAFRFDVDAYLTMDNPEASECVHLWDENFTDVEIDELTKPQPEEPSDLEKLKQENILLKAQNAALTERADFIEDVIAEMAAQVYQ
ncbi:hypothetical protein [Paenibacillus sp. M2]|uniref:hypothetical protein n=1 Tax=Paenibacillus sp. M2 TaxID=3341793 RepID=UPI0039898753